MEDSTVNFSFYVPWIFDVSLWHPWHSGGYHRCGNKAPALEGPEPPMVFPRKSWRWSEQRLACLTYCQETYYTILIFNLPIHFFHFFFYLFFQFVFFFFLFIFSSFFGKSSLNMVMCKQCMWFVGFSAFYPKYDLHGWSGIEIQKQSSVWAITV